MKILIMTICGGVIGGLCGHSYTEWEFWITMLAFVTPNFFDSSTEK